MKNQVLVTGATGATGKKTIENLLKLKIPVRAMVHKIDDRSDGLLAKGVEIIQGDLLNFEEVKAALKGITSAYFVFPILVPGLLEASAYFAQAALDSGVGAIVNMSQISAGKDAKSRASQNHWLAERLFDLYGVPVTHLRPTFFAEWLMYRARDINTNDRIVLPFGDARYAPIAAEDLGAVIASILADPASHAGRIYPLFGPKEHSQYEIAEILSGVLRRKITYVPIEIEPFKEVMKKEMNAGPYFIQHISAVAQDCRNGIFSGTNEKVEKITGRKPMHMVDYIIKNKALFQ